MTGPRNRQDVEKSVLQLLLDAQRKQLLEFSVIPPSLAIHPFFAPAKSVLFRTDRLFFNSLLKLLFSLYTYFPRL